MKKSFSLIEMIFVIVIIGIISIGTLNAIPDNTLLNNTKFLYNKILEKKANALSFMAQMDNKDENRTVCVVFDEEWLREDESYSKVKFNLSKRVTIKTENKTICFDYLGRPYVNRVNLETFDNLLYDSVDINISYSGSYKIITIYPMSGYVEIK